MLRGSIRRVNPAPRRGTLAAGRRRVQAAGMEAHLILFAAGLLAGAMNAAAGGGSFVTIPAMVFVGLPSVTANTSSTVEKAIDHA